MAKIVLKIKPPLAGVVSTNPNGFIMEQTIGPGATLGQLFTTLVKSDNVGWQEIWNIADDWPQHEILIIINNRTVPYNKIGHIVLNDGDVIVIGKLFPAG